jgi:hypothetical protein
LAAILHPSGERLVPLENAPELPAIARDKFFEKASSDVASSLEAYLWQDATLCELAGYFGVDYKVFHAYKSIDGESLLILAIRMNCENQTNLLLRVCPTLVGCLDSSNHSILQYLTSIIHPERIARIIAARLSSDAYSIDKPIKVSADLPTDSPQRAMLSLIIHDILMNASNGIDLLRREGFRDTRPYLSLCYPLVEEYAVALGVVASVAYGQVEAFRKARGL